MELQEKGYIRRTNGKRNGKWEVLIEMSFLYAQSRL